MPGLPGRGREALERRGGGAPNLDCLEGVGGCHGTASGDATGDEPSATRDALAYDTRSRLEGCSGKSQGEGQVLPPQDTGSQGGINCAFVKANVPDCCSHCVCAPSWSLPSRVTRLSEIPLFALCLRPCLARRVDRVVYCGGKGKSKVGSRVD